MCFKCLKSWEGAAGSHCGSHFFFIKSVSFGALFEASIDSPTLVTKHTFSRFFKSRLLCFPRGTRLLFLSYLSSQPTQVLAIFPDLVKISPSWAILILKHMYHFSDILFMSLWCSIENWWYSWCRLIPAWILSPKWIPSSLSTRVNSYKFLAFLSPSGIILNT